MKKAKINKKKHRRRKVIAISKNGHENYSYNLISLMMKAYKRSWLWFFICLFMAVWLGGHLIEAYSTLSIPNLRVPMDIEFDDSPIWFIFVLIFKIVFFIGGCAYIALFINDISRGKSA